MDSETDRPDSHPQPRQWPLLLLFALALTGGVYALYYAFTAQTALNAQLAGQNRRLAAQVTAMEKSLAARASSAQVIVPLQAELAHSQATLMQLEGRLQTVEKTTAAPPAIIQVTPPPAGDTETLQAFLALKQAIASGMPFAAQLAPMASLPQVKSILDGLVPLGEKGVASDSSLRRQLLDILAAHPPAQAPEDARLNTINTKLQGLLHVTRKTSMPVDDYATLRAQATSASLDVLITGVAQLPAEAQAPLADWLAAARERQVALATLAAAETALMKPAP